MKQNLVVLDSNVYFHNLPLKDPLFQALFTATINLNYILVVPEAILYEISNLYCEKIYNLIKESKELEIQLASSILGDNFSYGKEEIKEKYNQFFRFYLLTNKINHIFIVSRNIT